MPEATKYEDCKFKKDRIALLRKKLGTNAAWAKEGCKRIFEYQTAEEQNSESTMYWNGVGFSGADAEILSSFAKQLNEGKFAGSPKQMKILFQKMPKYAKQLDAIAQQKKEASEAAPPRGTNISRRQAIAHGVVTYTGD